MGVIVFFHILHGEYFLKKKTMVVQISQWTFKANIARNVTFKDVSAKFLSHLGQKWQKNDYFQKFHFSLSVLNSQN